MSSADLTRILTDVAEDHGYTFEHIYGRDQRGGLPNTRKLAIKAAAEAGYSEDAIAMELDRSPQTIHNVLIELGLLTKQNRGTRSSGSRKSGAAHGPPSPDYEHGNDRLSRLRRLRRRLEHAGLREIAVYRETCARIVDLEVGDDYPTSGAACTDPSQPIADPYKERSVAS